jgi:FkbM family methyltransferase
LATTFAKLREQVDPERPFFFGELSNGIRFAGDSRDFPAALHAIYPHSNATLIRGLTEALGGREGDAIDVGANIGVVAASLARHLGPRGRVHAFEPSPSTFNVAAATLALNDLDNVTLIEAVVGDANEDVVFHTTPGNSAIASARWHDDLYLCERSELVVPSRTLDRWAEESGLANLLLVKIDVEGYEMNVLRGSLQTIKRHRPTMVYEYTAAAAQTQGWTDRDAVLLLNEVGSFEFSALVEPSLTSAASEPRRVEVPLPSDSQEQVNIFAVPKRSDREPPTRWDLR